MAEKSDQTTLSVLTHILGLFTYFIGALVIFLVSKDKKVKEHAKNALNWQISLTIYMIISAILIILIIGILLIVALGILNIVFCIIAAVKASEGKLWRYPLSINFFKAD